MVQLRPVRIRLPELLEKHDLTAYAVAQRSGGRIQAASLYRLAKRRGRAKYLHAELLEALCDVFDVEPGELLEREGKRRGR